MTIVFILISLILTPSLYSLWRDMQTRQPIKRTDHTPMIEDELLDLSLPDKSKKNPIYEGDILDELSRTSLHILFGVMSGGGKSTSMKVIIWKIHQRDRAARFYIVDPKTTDWLGLQMFRNTVTYLSGDVLDQLLQLRDVTEQIFETLDDRISKGQKILKNGGQLDAPGHHIYLIIDEWYALYDALQKFPAKLKAEYGLTAILSHINTIIAKGREHNVHIFLVSQTHLSGETGISTAMRRSMALIGQGRLTEDGDGGYASIEGIIKDANVFKDSNRRNQLMQRLKDAIALNEANAPIILTTMGNPRLGLLSDLSYIHTYKIEDYLK